MYININNDDNINKDNNEMIFFILLYIKNG